MDKLPTPPIDLNDFGVPELFVFGSQISLEGLSPANLLVDTKILLQASILRYLTRVLPTRLPPQLDEFNAALQPHCVRA
jgi:hypothetical protein